MSEKVIDENILTMKISRSTVYTYHNIYDEEDIDSYDYNGNDPYNDAPESEGQL